MSAAEDGDENTTITNPDVRRKYNDAARVANEVLKLLVTSAKVGKKVLDLCALGDSTITERTSKMYNKGEEKIEKGIAFPTCVNVNNIVCHYSPLPDDAIELKEGDVVKIDLGVHIDGYAAVVAHTVVVQEKHEQIDGRVADLVVAAQLMMEVATRSLRAGVKNADISALWEKIAEDFGVTLCEGVLSHKLKRFVLDGNQVILSKPSIEHRVAECEFGPGEVWTIDVLLSSGKGKLNEQDSRCLVFKRQPDTQYMLKLNASKQAFKEINTKFQTFPFALRALDAKSGRMGVTECLKHELVAPYPVLYEKHGEDVVHFKKTILIGPNSILPITGGAPQQKFASEKKCEDPAVMEALAASLGDATLDAPPPNPNSKRATKRANKKKEAEAGKEEGDEEPTAEQPKE